MVRFNKIHCCSRIERDSKIWRDRGRKKVYTYTIDPYNITNRSIIRSVIYSLLIGWIVINNATPFCRIFKRRVQMKALSPNNCIIIEAAKRLLGMAKGTFACIIQFFKDRELFVMQHGSSDPPISSWWL